MNHKTLKVLLRERTPESWRIAADLYLDMDLPRESARTRALADVVGHLMPIVRERTADMGYAWHPIPGTDFEVRLGGRQRILTLLLCERVRDVGSPQYYEYHRRLTQHLSWSSIRGTPGHLFKRLLEVAEVVVGKEESCQTQK